MRITVFGGDISATLLTRIIPLTQELQRIGYDVDLVRPTDWSLISKGRVANLLSFTLKHSPKIYFSNFVKPPDLIIVNRVATPQMYLFQKMLAHRNVKVIFDLDDPLFLNTSNLIGFNLRPGTFCLENIIKNSNFVTATSNFILNFVKNHNSRFALIHPPIDTNIFSPERKKRHKKITIGWQGSPFSHIKNLALLLKPVEKIAHEYDIKFKLVSHLGNQKVKQMFSKLERYAEVDYGLDHWVSSERYVDLLSDFDIMLAPLVRSLWYEGKSVLRVGLSMALGVPVVASPVGEQKYLIKHGINGYLAENDLDWYTYIKKLIDDDELRSNMGIKARSTAVKNLSLEVCGKEYSKIINKVLKYT